MYLLLVILLCVPWLVSVGQVSGMQEVWCPSDDHECSFDLVVDYGLTLMWRSKLAKVIDGHLYLFDVTNTSQETEIPLDDVITADGYDEPRFVMTFNGTIPGPALHVTSGQVVRLRVHNNMMHETTSVHIHGQYQRGTPFSDGVPYVTQCPILPGQIFEQVFVADPQGSFFYHSHSGPQMTNGLYGAFIVHPRVSQGSATSATQLPAVEMDEHILMVQDWNHDWDSNLMTAKMRFGIFSGGQKYKSTMTHAGVRYSGFPFHSGLINGRGRFYSVDGNHNNAPLSAFNVTSGKKYRFRLFNPSDIYPFRVSVDSHRLLVTSTDGNDVIPVSVQSIIIHPGERFDVIIEASQPVSNYWIRGVTLEINVNHTAEAILHYQGAPEGFEPTTTDWACSPDEPCRVLNCPFMFYPSGAHTMCLNVDKMQAAEARLLQPEKDRGVVEFFLNFGFPGHHETPSSVNGRAFVSQVVNPLAKSNHPLKTCDREDCGNNKVCHCPYHVTYSQGDLVQLVLLNMGQGSGWDHPVHMHGHSFQVVKMGYPTYNSSTGQFVAENPDIDCGPGTQGMPSFCNSARWANTSWESGAVPGVELERAPIKDTVVVPSGGYVVIRFKADNPGLWLIHCHLELHMTDGMVALLNESYSQWPSPPENFPTCGHYFDTTSSRMINLQKYGPR
ncbi:uncharacterized protein LOC131948095 isoform X3 [Physella acuta]|uniref:uncharacterized protein LOC131948095 isoform X3 n=1 Tax=Physella acuta TaxID=109671 RepID=UPI0027DDA5EE|nr:uncharacterized protein LOC131948095 isoform X3 [Physella acuta]